MYVCRVWLFCPQAKWLVNFHILPATHHIATANLPATNSVFTIIELLLFDISFYLWFFFWICLLYDESALVCLSLPSWKPNFPCRVGRTELNWLRTSKTYIWSFNQFLWIFAQKKKKKASLCLSLTPNSSNNNALSWQVWSATNKKHQFLTSSEWASTIHTNRTFEGLVCRHEAARVQIATSPTALVLYLYHVTLLLWPLKSVYYNRL